MEKQRRHHVLVITYPAQGHINPLLQFTKLLASLGLNPTFATTPYAATAIRATGFPVEPISDGFDQGGFHQAPSTQAYMETARTVGSKALTQLILKYKTTPTPVVCVVYDTLVSWAGDVAKKMGIPKAMFMTNTASACWVYWHVHKRVLQLPVNPVLPVALPGLPPLGASELPEFVAEPVRRAEYLGWVMDICSCIEENDWVFLNSFYELESEVVEAMSGSWQALMIGPMLPSAYLNPQKAQHDTDYGGSLWEPTIEKCMRWLNTNPPNSVIYISSGSMAELEPKQVIEIVHGLELMGRPFLWVVKEAEQDKLPMEFLNSVKEDTAKGMIVGWCKQLEVLAHESVGCFVTHCGWNSTLEGITLGVPMVAVPRWSDQPMNAKFVEEVWEVGVRGKRDEEGVVSREELKRCVSEVMVGKRSEEIRKNSREWRDKALRAMSEGGSSKRNVDKFLQELQNKVQLDV